LKSSKSILNQPKAKYSHKVKYHNKKLLSKQSYLPKRIYHLYKSPALQK
jgi:hypothetical protein